MAKLTLTDIAAGYVLITTFNANNTLLETALENTLSRDGTAPNTMSANLDMNSNNVVNVTDGVNNQDAVTVAQLNAAVVNSLTTLDGVGNVDTTGKVTGDLLYYNGTNWVDTAGNFQWNGTTLVLAEVASAAADVAGKGQIWVKNTTPNELWFTDDAGTDVQLGTGNSFPLLAPDGTAGAPSYSFTDESDMGFYRSAAGRTAWAENGADVFEFDDANSGMFRGADTEGPFLRNVAATTSAPNIGADRGDTNTGIGSGGNDTLSLIAGGINAVEYTEANNEVLKDNNIDAGQTASVTQTQGQGGLFSSYNEISTVANANDTVTLPEAAIGRECTIANNGANTLQVFPASGDDLGAGTDASETIGAGRTVTYLAHTAAAWNRSADGTQGGALTVGVNGCKAFNTALQSISDNTDTVVALAGEAYDTNSLHDTVTNNSRITIPSGVTRVRLTGYVTWQLNGSSYRQLRIRKNGSDGAIDDAQTTYQPEVFMSAANGTAPDQGQYIDSGIITTAATDYFELLVFQNSTATLDLRDEQCWFQCEVIE